VTVDFFGHEKVDKELKSAGLYLGSEWSEQSAGTCGVGACLQSGEAITVHHSDHFDFTHRRLSCSAAPIFDSFGSLLAVLDISLLDSASAKSSQKLALEVLKSCARRIEMANLMSLFKNNWVVKLSSSPEFLEVDPNCAFAVSDEGKILAVTNVAQRFLAKCVSLNWRRPSNIIGKKFEDFFDFDFNDLNKLSPSAEMERKVLILKNGEMVFASASCSKSVKSQLSIRSEVPKPLSNLHGGDPTIEAIAQKASRVLHTQISIILNGETGVGKEFIAKSLHQARSLRGRFVAINCAGLPESLIESELFGYAPGAFTGASSKGKMGLIEQANGGTLFLDEIGDMPLTLQARLLRVLAEREVSPVGSAKTINVNIRVVSATHKDLKVLVQNGKFREDLYYRLNGIVFDLPAVRMRNDFGWLLKQIVALFSKNDKKYSISNDAFEVLQKYSWPGNVRQMINVIELSCALSDESEVRLEHLPDFIVLENHSADDFVKSNGV
jgi:transcriptional regulator of acetoin/glycerol metabolism